MAASSDTKRKLGSDKLKLLDRAAENKSLTAADWRILVKCVGWTGPKGSFSKPVSYIAKASHASKATVKRAMVRMGETGFIERIGRHNDIGNAANEYRLCFTPHKAAQAIARESRRSKRDKKRAPKSRAGGRKDAPSGGAAVHPLGAQGCDTYSPYSSPISSLDADGAARSPNGGSVQRDGFSISRNIGDILSRPVPSTEDGTHSRASGDGNNGANSGNAEEVERTIGKQGDGVADEHEAIRATIQTAETERKKRNDAAARLNRFMLPDHADKYLALPAAEFNAALEAEMRGEGTGVEMLRECLEALP